MDVPTPPELLGRIGRTPAALAIDLLQGEDMPRTAAVGGFVRDLLRGATPLDLDLVVEGPVGPVVERLGGSRRAHDRFATAEVELDWGRVDVASARTERYAHPGALPRVEPATLERDLERRDFTVNAIAVRVDGDSPGGLSYVPGALEDLAAGRLRVLHAASFVDDPTRLLRLARYAARLGFEPEPETLRLAGEAIAGGALATVSGTRIGNELRLLAREPDPVGAFVTLRELGIDRAIDPRFGLTDEQWAARALELLGGRGRPDRLVLALAVRRLGREAGRGLLERLGFTAEDRDAIVEAAVRAPTLCAAMSVTGRPSQLAAAVGGAGAEAVALAGAIGPAEATRRWLSELQHVRSALTGEDLLAAGVPAGPAVGRGLAAAHAAALDGEASDRAAQLEVALRAARGGADSQ